jgi:hypothetical protein
MDLDALSGVVAYKHTGEGVTTVTAAVDRVNIKNRKLVRFTKTCVAIARRKFLVSHRSKPTRLSILILITNNSSHGDLRSRDERSGHICDWKE